MAQIKELIQGNVGRISELRKVGENNHVITVSIAATPRVKKGTEWTDGETVWTDVTVWGDTAKNISDSDIKPGTSVLVYGTRVAQEREAYIKKDGTTVEKHVEQKVNAEIFSVEVTRWNTIKQIEKAQRDGAPTPTKSAAAAAVEDPFSGSAKATPTSDIFNDDDF